jgi:hypothetical protein
MYLKLFDSQVKAIELLQQAQVDAESMYVDADETPIELKPKEGK